MNDLISRQAVLDICHKKYWNGADDYYPISAREIEKEVRKLPSAEPDVPDTNVGTWIPCSERLPNDIKPVIVTWKNTDPKSYYQYIVGKHYTGVACYKSGRWYWYSSTTEDILAEYGRCDFEEFDEAIEVIAWMPLSEPYTEEQK